MNININLRYQTKKYLSGIVNSCYYSLRGWFSALKSARVHKSKKNCTHSMHESIINLVNFVPCVTQGKIIGVSKQLNFFYTKPFILLLVCQDIS